jgi:PPP5 TPR repeat region
MLSIYMQSANTLHHMYLKTAQPRHHSMLYGQQLLLARWQLLPQSRPQLSRVPLRPQTVCAGNQEQGYTVTLEFVKAMIEHFRQEKLIHRRFAFEIVLKVP